MFDDCVVVLNVVREVWKEYLLLLLLGVFGREEGCFIFNLIIICLVNGVKVILFLWDNNVVVVIECLDGF